MDDIESSEKRGVGIVRPLACIVGILVAPIALGLLVPWLLVGPSSTGWLYLVGTALIWGGLLTSPWRRERHRGMVRLGAALFALAVIIRLLAAPDGDSMEMQRIPESNLAASLLNRPVPEADSALVGAWWILVGSTYIDDVDDTLLDAMSESYAMMAEDEGIVGSPWAATYLGMQSRESFDMQVFEADGDAAVIFLHGFGGNFTLPCWEVAQAAERANVATFCPSTEWQGRWWLGGAVAVLRETLEHVRAEGYDRVYLAGLSNGGIGLSRIAPKFADDVDGLIFISGISAHATPTALPTLVIHGDRDVMTETSVAATYARQAYDGKYIQVSGGHFVLLEDREVIRPAIADWLQTR
jgi:pimeloyl-ACP methyl ester carboxylesterase